MGSSIGVAIDYLVAACRDGVTVSWRGVTLPPLTAINPKVEVVDGNPTTSDGAWVVIGRDDWGQDAGGTGTSAYAELGGERVEEAYTLPCFVHAIADGSIQKTARDAVVGLYDGVVRVVHADPTLGGLLQRGRIAVASRLTLTQQNTSGGTESVSAMLHFDIEIHNTYIP